MKKILSLIMMFCVAQLFFSQEVVIVSGGESSGSYGSVSYSVGQVFYSTNISISGSLSQGVQQAFEFQSLSNTKLISIHLQALIYPNPTTDFIELKITDSTLKNLSYSLFDMNGKSISRDIIAGSITQIRMQHLAIGGYLLKVNQQNKILKTFKIIKHQ